VQSALIGPIFVLIDDYFLEHHTMWCIRAHVIGEIWFKNLYFGGGEVCDEAHMRGKKSDTPR